MTVHQGSFKQSPEPPKRWRPLVIGLVCLALILFGRNQELFLATLVTAFLAARWARRRGLSGILSGGLAGGLVLTSLLMILESRNWLANPTSWDIFADALGNQIFTGFIYGSAWGSLIVFSTDLFLKYVIEDLFEVQQQAEERDSTVPNTLSLSLNQESYEAADPSNGRRVA